MFEDLRDILCQEIFENMLKSASYRYVEKMIRNAKNANKQLRIMALPC